jgi:deoxyribose-phosphate aldolase
MNYTQSQVAATIDHAVLKPEMTERDLEAAAQMCRERGVGALCVRPCDVSLASQLLADCSTKVCAVIGFPHGANKTETKVLEARLALEEGATEIDMVMNIGQFLSDNHPYVQQDIKAVTDEVHKNGAILKVILETCLLTTEQIARACLLAKDAGADFVKTSTGFSSGGATPDAVRMMLETVGSTMQVKASGGIRSWQDAVDYLEMGCTRLGIGSTEAVLDGGTSTTDY